MFSFDDPNPTILERNIRWGDAEKKYRDKFMIVINAHVKETYLHGDIVAILTPEEYSGLDFPESMAPKYDVWKGLKLKMEGLGALGYYL